MREVVVNSILLNITLPPRLEDTSAKKKATGKKRGFLFLHVYVPVVIINLQLTNIQCYIIYKTGAETQ